jgi:hypothetical protein
MFFFNHRLTELMKLNSTKLLKNRSIDWKGIFEELKKKNDKVR